MNRELQLTEAAPELFEALVLSLDLLHNGGVDFAKYGLTCDDDIRERYVAALGKALGLKKGVDGKTVRKVLGI